MRIPLLRRVERTTQAGTPFDEARHSRRRPRGHRGGRNRRINDPHSRLLRGALAPRHFGVFSSIDVIADAPNALSTSQIALSVEVCDAVYETNSYTDSIKPNSHITLESDNVFSGGCDQQTPETSGDFLSGYGAVLNVPIDTTTPNSGCWAVQNIDGVPGEPPNDTPPSGMPSPSPR